MARYDFGGTLADFVVTSHRLGNLDALALSAATLTMWSAQSGGTRYTDLVLNGSAVTSISVATDGQVPTFQGPDGVTSLWADGGAGRVRMAASGVDAVLASFVPMAATPPDPTKVRVYVDLSTLPPTLKGWDGAAWVPIGGGVGGGTTSSFTVVDNGDGTSTVAAIGSASITDNGDGTSTLVGGTVTDNLDGTASIAA